MHGKCWDVCENYSCVKRSYEHEMFARLKEIYRANTIALTINFVGGTQARILDTTYHQRSRY